MHPIENSDADVQLNNDTLALTFIHTPFCGTCHLARKMLETLEASYNKELFYELNASLHPELMQKYKIESVPCLLVTENGKPTDKVYAFHSVPFMYDKVSQFVSS
ncbi:thioredoxin family protein [Halobacillus salinarum]|uniref:Thioredoxin family protein n=1 Tax=Halobacillus salinarum TaxID=2932257 RepID=A0ABY4EQR7_9BACI|nr:thioredoxin family protein [Halobacillus salinarum]UOQ46022.1 thioredoxin family protein [Halobacillus salinarum]